jgi:NADP-dependent 3-hydroxy acid dehydrogenase YdfG
MFQSISPNAVATEFLDDATFEDSDEIYNSIQFLGAKDVADAIVCALETPQSTVITELVIRPMKDTY